MNIINDVLVDKLFKDKPKRTKEIPLLEEKSVSGESIIIQDAYPDMPFKCLHVYGKSTQVTTTGAQLFDKRTCTSGHATDDGVINRNGEVGEKDNIISGYIQCNEKENYTSSQSVWKWFFYNEEKRFIKSETDKTKVTAPDMAKYLVLFYSVNKVNALKYLDNIMVNVGTSSLALEPYTGGKPSPSIEYPQEITSSGDKGEIGVSVYGGNLIPETQIVDISFNKKEEPQTLTLKTPNGLPGIPVPTGGNYTDSKGQQWVTDEVDLERGKYIQRVEKVNFDGSADERWKTNLQVKLVYANIGLELNSKRKYDLNILCNSSKPNAWNNKAICFINEYKLFSFYCNDIPASVFENADNFKAWLVEHPLEIVYQIAEPIERDLTPEEIAAYKALHTNYPTTTIVNDENAGMEVTYLTPSFIPTRESALRMWFKENPII